MKKCSAGFTLIELLVVIAITALLTSLALPNILKALTKGQMTQTLSNGRQLYLATETMAMDASTGGSTVVGWPGDAATPSFSKWATALSSGYISTNEFCKLSSAPGVQVAKMPTVAAETAFKIYPVQENSPSDTIFLITRNATVKGSGTDLTITLDPTVKPYGNQGCVIIHRGGDGVILLPQQLQSSRAIGSVVEGEPLE
jgi:prepilin-type N-terminal cleavage/methylation domain-containing protein